MVSHNLSSNTVFFPYLGSKEILVSNPIILFLRKLFYFKKGDLNLMLKKNKSNHFILSSLKRENRANT